MSELSTSVLAIVVRLTIISVLFILLQPCLVGIFSWKLTWKPTSICVKLSCPLAKNIYIFLPCQKYRFPKIVATMQSANQSSFFYYLLFGSLHCKALHFHLLQFAWTLNSSFAFYLLYLDFFSHNLPSQHHKKN